MGDVEVYVQFVDEDTAQEVGLVGLRKLIDTPVSFDALVQTLEVAAKERPRDNVLDASTCRLKHGRGTKTPCSSFEVDF